MLSHNSSSALQLALAYYAVPYFVADTLRWLLVSSFVVLLQAFLGLGRSLSNNIARTKRAAIFFSRRVCISRCASLNDTLCSIQSDFKASELNIIRFKSIIINCAIIDCAAGLCFSLYDSQCLTTLFKLLMAFKCKVLTFAKYFHFHMSN